MDLMEALALRPSDPRRAAFISARLSDEVTIGLKSGERACKIRINPRSVTSTLDEAFDIDGIEYRAGEKIRRTLFDSIAFTKSKRSKNYRYTCTVEEAVPILVANPQLEAKDE